jgi:hypothetical protein
MIGGRKMQIPIERLEKRNPRVAEKNAAKGITRLLARGTARYRLYRRSEYCAFTVSEYSSPDRGRVFLCQTPRDYLSPIVS